MLLLKKGEGKNGNIVHKEKCNIHFDISRNVFMYRLAFKDFCNIMRTGVF